MLQYNDSHDKAQRMFERISEAFNEQKITPTPINYLVWYEYYKGQNPKLRQEMDRVLNDPFGFNDRIGRRLFDEYINEQDQTSELDRVFKRLLDAMVKKLASWTEKLESSTDQLNQYSQSLGEKEFNQDELKQLTHSVMTTTNEMRDHSASFQLELNQALTEIQSLRRQLIEARAETMKDDLTELGNRRAFNMALDELCEQANDQPETLHLIMADIDHFKGFNDTFGHLVGDSVLRYFSNLMKKLQTPKQTICRYGGEEFAIIVSQSTLEEAREVAERVREQIQEAHLKRKGTNQNLPTITASFGLAQYRGLEGDTHESFTKRADDMLYEAKKQGRNRVVTEFDPPSAS